MKVNKKLKINSMNGKETLIQKFSPDKHSIKNIYSDKLAKLYSKPPSNFGYKSDIEGMMNQLSLTKEQLLGIVINSLQRSSRTKPEIRVISSYLFLMQDFLKLLKAKTPEKKENLLLKDLLILGENIEYEKVQKNTVFMRFGEKGNNAYIILNGKVDVLIEHYFPKTIEEKTYLYYLANLIRYHEFGLVNSIVNKNFNTFPIEIIDDITNPELNINNSKKNKYEYNMNNNQNENSNNNILYTNDNINNIDNSSKKSARYSSLINVNQNNIRFSFNKELYINFKRNNTFREKCLNKKQSVFRLNFEYEEFKETIPKYSARELLDMFGLKLMEKKDDHNLNDINTDEYIKRLNIFNNGENVQSPIKIKKDEEPKEFEQSLKKIKEDEEPKEYKNHKKIISEKKIHKNNSNISSNIEKNNNENTEEMNNKSSESKKLSISSNSSDGHLMNENILKDIKLCTYTKIITLESGALFGEMALNDPNALRKATIITSSECHFGVLNKKTFNNSIKMGAQKHMKETLQFFIENPIFNGIPEGLFYSKYYKNLSKDTIVKGKKIIIQGEKPEQIILLQTGCFEIKARMSLCDLTKLMLYYIDFLVNHSHKTREIDKKSGSKNLKEKNSINNKNNNKSMKKEEKKSGLNKLIDIQKTLNEDSSLLIESSQFKKYYHSLQYIKIAEIYSPDIILSDEFVNENGLYAFTIEAKSYENIIYTLKNKFLVDIHDKAISIQKNKEKFLKQKMKFMLKRLLIIRNSLINLYYDSKAKIDIGKTVFQELEDNDFINFKKKRLLNRKEEIILNTNENQKLIINNRLFLNKNFDRENFYRSTGESNPEKNSFFKIYNSKASILKKQLKPFKSYDKSLLQFESKAKSKINKGLNTEQLKPIKISLKTVINFTKNFDKDKENIIPKKKKNFVLNLQNNEEGPLFYLKDTKNIYNLNKSRNNDGKKYFKEFSLHPDKNNEFEISKTPKVVMNNLIWENVKSRLKIPIKLDFENININNINESNNKNIIHINYSTHEGYKSFNNRYIQKNYDYINNNDTKKNGGYFSFANSFHNIQIQHQNHFCYLSPQANKKTKRNNNHSLSAKKVDNSHNKIQKYSKSVKCLKKKETLLKMRMKKLISPEEICLMRINRKNRKLNYFMDRNKYNQIKEEKFKTNWKYYFKKNIMNRINFFYGKTEK